MECFDKCVDVQRKGESHNSPQYLCAYYLNSPFLEDSSQFMTLLLAHFRSLLSKQSFQCK